MRFVVLAILLAGCSAPCAREQWGADRTELSILEKQLVAGNQSGAITDKQFQATGPQVMQARASLKSADDLLTEADRQLGIAEGAIAKLKAPATQP